MSQEQNETNQIRADISKFSDSRNRVSHQIQRNMDAFQIHMNIRWKNFMYYLSLGISVALVVCTFFTIIKDDNSLSKVTPSDFFELAMMTFLATFMSSVARDLLTAIQYSRKNS